MPSYNNKYDYTREAINRSDRLYEVGHEKEGEPKPLAKEIEETFPGKKFIVRCNGTALCVLFEDELTAGEKTTLDTVVSDHKNNL